MQEQRFFHNSMQTFRRDWIRFGRNEKKNSLLKHSSSTQDVFQVWKIAGQISRLCQEFNTLYEPRGVFYCLVVLFLLLYVILICALVTTGGTQDCSFTRIDTPETYPSYNIPDGIPLPASLFPFSPTAK